MSTVNGTITIRGVELEVFSELEVQWVDDSFSHEFGTEHCGHAEVETIEPVELDDDVRERAAEALEHKGRQHRRRLFIKWVRRILREVAALDPYSFWTGKQLEDAIEGWDPPEPDYPEREDR